MSDESTLYNLTADAIRTICTASFLYKK